MKKIKIVFGIAVVILLNSCVEEKDMTPDCGKWEVEINNPEATVVIEDGILVIDVPNPKTAKDVRIIQRQSSEYIGSEVGVYLSGGITEAVPVDEYSHDYHVKYSFAYVSDPENPFITRINGGYGNQGYFYGEKVYESFQSGSNYIFGEADEVVFDTRSPNPIKSETPISASPKLFYIDVGVNPARNNGRPTASIHVEIDWIKFYGSILTQFDETQFTEKDKQRFGFKWDDFDCNSLIN